ncbi:FAD-dependent oxidoreductase [Bacteroides faecichinchillae]|uniref:Glycine/D-amino acid oxidase n=1 Tax=Bacteroides faecichinchillae TaxID=871325 RepID=A0A1M5A3F8_9BACE|nr:FAD-dependent oxidoreductase [Bacteroides faecichinchillae]THG68460.1 FAD-dependent oxidoreductase [Bacteroides faecichinchillae]SHF24754.1 Glycine/D-amino acid oxidase [Bacteroides faecichinchillae]
MDLHSGLPYWIVRNSLLDYYHPLENDLTTDIAIIGSGITGALMAHELCRAGIECCIIDKRSIATGSSAASTALLQYEIDVPLYRMAGIIGEKNAETAYHACLQSITDIKKVLEETGVDAGYEQLPSLFYASSPADNKLLEQEYEMRRKHKLPVSLLKKKEAKERFNVETPGNALVNETSAQIDAYRAATGLLTYHIKENGLKVFTHTDIKECTETSDGCIMTTDKGYKIKCGYAIIATGFEAGQFLPKVIMDLTSTYALISHPVAPEYLWPTHCLIWETADPYLYIRTTDGNRIIIGGEDEKFSDPQRRDSLLRNKTHILEKKFRKLLPNIPFKTEMAWCGTFSTTKDGLPFIGNWPDKKRIFFDLGYGGNGITFSMIGAQIICHMLQGIKDERSSVFGYKRIEKYW